MSETHRWACCLRLFGAPPTICGGVIWSATPRRQQTDAGGQGAALVVEIDPEAAEIFANEAEVDGLFLLQLFALPGLQQRKHQSANILGIERGSPSLDECAVDADLRVSSHLARAKQ